MPKIGRDCEASLLCLHDHEEKPGGTTNKNHRKFVESASVHALLFWAWSWVRFHHIDTGGSERKGSHFSDFILGPCRLLSLEHVDFSAKNLAPNP